MPGRTGRYIATGLFAVYVAVNVALFGVTPLLTDWPYWGVAVRDALGIGAAMAVGLPLFAATFDIKPG